MPKRKRGGSRSPAAAPVRTPPHQAAAAAEPERTAMRWLTWLFAAAVLLLASLLALQPISSDELWWQLSRGRQTLSTGALWPSVQLLAHETRGEANALGAVLVAAAYQVAGASGLMLLRLSAVGLVTWWSVRRLHDLIHRRAFATASLAAVVSMLAAVALVQQFDPLPTLADALAIAVLAALGRRSDSVPSSPKRDFPQLTTRSVSEDQTQEPAGSLLAPRVMRKADLAYTKGLHLTCLAATFIAWANLGNLVFIGLCLVVVTALAVTARALAARRAEFSSAVAAAGRAWMAVAIALLAGCLNPIGLRVWWESFAQAVPWAVAPAWALQHTPWVPLTQSPWTFPTAVFALLSGGWIAWQFFATQTSPNVAGTLRVPSAPPHDPSHGAPVAGTLRVPSASPHEPAGHGAPVAGTLRVPSAPPREPAGHGTRSVPATLEPLASLALLQFFVWTSAAALPLGIAWIWSDWLESTKTATGPFRMPWHKNVAGTLRVPSAQNVAGTLHVPSASPHEPGHGTRSVPATLARPSPHLLAAVLLPLVVIGVLAAELARTAGWGIAARLDPRFLQLALAGTRDRGTIFADDTRSAGIAAWVAGVIPPSDTQASDEPTRGRRASEPSDEAALINGLPAAAPERSLERLQVQDEPRRALIGGRLATDQRLWQDLREGRQMRYWRADATPGGWWLPLRGRHTSLLAFSRRDVRLIRRLEPSIWKPLSLESPVLPYARAGDPHHSPKILEILSQRETIDARPWVYQPPPSSGSAFDRDGWGLLPRRHDLTSTLRQAEVFLAMELRIAALRVLAYGLEQQYGDGHQEPAAVELKRLWQQCQVELADQEQLLAGRPSRMRALAAAASPPAPTSAADPLQTATAVYNAAGPRAAIQHARQASPLSADLRYALLCWAVESGRYAEALQQIESLTNTPNLPAELALLAHQHRHRLRWFSNPSMNPPQTAQSPPERERKH